MLTNLQISAPESAPKHISSDSVRSSVPAAETKIDVPSGEALNSKILRFAKSERVLHWAIAGPFLVSFATGVILVLFYNPDPSRSGRSLFAILHRFSGIALGTLPILALLRGRHDFRIHIYNIKQAWTWIYDDFKWLALMGLAAISSRFVLPEQGKFNAAEKLNFMVLMSTYPLYVITGLLMWLLPLAVLSWIMHCLMALMATPLVLGHLYMALINAETRPGLEGMISGHVDRKWAKHHYRRWYRSFHEAAEEEFPQKATVVDPAAPVPLNAVSPQLESHTIAPDGKSLPLLHPKERVAGMPSDDFEQDLQAIDWDEQLHRSTDPAFDPACTAGREPMTHTTLLS